MRRFINRVAVVAVLSTLALTTSYAGVSGYGGALYTDDCYTYANVSMSRDTFTEAQIRINTAILAQANVVFSSDHYNSCYTGIDTPIFNSFRQHFNGLCALSFSIAEWGGNGDLRYSFTPAIATKRLVNAGVDVESINPLQINTEYYISSGVTSFGDRTYLGPLQINKNYFSPTASYKCGYIPMDYYSWPEACQWTFHNKCEMIKSAWNKNYVFKSSYAVIAHTAIAHNSGGTHLTSQSFQLDTNWYPWKNSQAVFDYVDCITSDDNIQIILNDADKYADNLLVQFRDGIAKGALYKSIGECRLLTQSMNIDWSKYVKSHWVGNMTSTQQLSGDALKNWEKTMYPVQAIWNYRVLERLYGLIQ